MFSLLRETSCNFLSFPLSSHITDSWTHPFSFAPFAMKATFSYLGKEYNLWYLDFCQLNKISFENVAANKMHPATTFPLPAHIVISHTHAHTHTHTHSTAFRPHGVYYISVRPSNITSWLFSKLCFINRLCNNLFNFSLPLITLGRNYFCFVKLSIPFASCMLDTRNSTNFSWISNWYNVLKNNFSKLYIMKCGYRLSVEGVGGPEESRLEKCSWILSIHYWQESIPIPG